MNIFNIIKKLISYNLLPIYMLIHKIIKPKTLIVLGMHRSGTSCITRIINQNGLSLGSEIIQPDKGNPNGYWENLSVYWINERILKKSKGSWDNPPKKIVSSFYIKLEILRIFYIRNFKNPHLLIKDPRMVLTWEIWKKYIKNYHVLAVFRNPKSVANSLFKRDRLDVEKGLKLWENYNDIILRIADNQKIVLLNFDDEKSFKSKIEQIIGNLKLDFNLKSLEVYNPLFKTSDNLKNQVNNKIYNKLKTKFYFN